MLRVFAYLFLLVFQISWSCNALSASERVDQKTSGNNAPAQFNANGATGIITYNIENNINQTFSDVRSKFSECLDITVAFQRERLEDLNIMLAGLLMKSGTVPEENTKKWAEVILKDSPSYQEGVEKNNNLIEKYNQELSKNMTSKIYKTFVYMIETIDSKLQALKDVSPNTTYTKNEKFELFSDEISIIKPYVIRSFILKNGNQIRVTVEPGQLRKGIVTTCPSISFAEFKEKIRGESFRVYPRYPTPVMVTNYAGPELKKVIRLENVKYDNRGSEILTDSFKEEFEKSFTEFIKLTFIP